MSSMRHSPPTKLADAECVVCADDDVCLDAESCDEFERFDMAITVVDDVSVNRINAVRQARCRESDERDDAFRGAFGVTFIGGIYSKPFEF